MVAPSRHRHNNSDLWPIPKSDTETDLPPSPYPSEIGDPAEGHEPDTESDKVSDTEGEDPRQLSRRHTLPSLDDHGRSRLCPPLSAKSPPRTYTAVTFHTPGAVFARGSSEVCFARRSSTQSTIVCGENNWMAHVDWETASVTSAPSAGPGAGSASQQISFSDGVHGSGDLGWSTERGRSIHPRHHSTTDLVSGPPRRRKHHTDPDIASVLSEEAPSHLTSGRRERADSETPFISAASLWAPDNVFGSASSVKRRATVHHNGRPRLARQEPKAKTPELRDAAWSLRK